MLSKLANNSKHPFVNVTQRIKRVKFRQFYPLCSTKAMLTCVFAT